MNPVNWEKEHLSHFNSYKQNETSKILQIFHIAALMNIAIFSYKLSSSNSFACSLLFIFSFVCLFFSYSYFYLADMANLRVTECILLGKYTDDAWENDHQYYKTRAPELQKKCFFFAIGIYLFCTLGLIALFSPWIASLEVANCLAYSMSITVFVFTLFFLCLGYSDFRKSDPIDDIAIEEDSKGNTK